MLRTRIADPAAVTVAVRNAAARRPVRSRTGAPRRLAAALLVAAGAAGSLSACAGAAPAPHRAVAAVPDVSPSVLGTPPSAAAGRAGHPGTPQTRLPSAAPTATGGAAAPAGTRAPESATASRAPKPGPDAGGERTPSPAPTSSAGTHQRLPEGRLTVADTSRLTVEITGLPASPRLASGGAPVEFTAVLRNNGTTDHPRIAPVVRFEQYEGGLAPLGSVGGRLERFDPATRTWREDFLPQASGMDFLLAASGGAPLPRGATTTIRYRVTLAPGLRPGGTELQVYAVSQPSNQQAGVASAKVTVTS